MTTMTDRDRGSILTAAVWMVVLSLLLFWIPVIGPLIAGFVGGQKAGSGVNGLIAGIVPAAIVSIALILLGTLVALPIIGVLVGAGIFIVMLIESVPLLIAAFLGGAMSDRRL